MKKIKKLSLKKIIIATVDNNNKIIGGKIQPVSENCSIHTCSDLYTEEDCRTLPAGGCTEATTTQGGGVPQELTIHC